MTKTGRLGDVRLNIYTILTQSMYPTIEAGDVVITYKDVHDKYNKGDIITFVSEANGGLTITHRVTQVYNVNGEYSYQTKGDNNNTVDSSIVKGSDVLGQVRVRVPKVGYAQQFMSTKTGFIAVILIPCLGIVIYDILKVVKAAARKGKSIVMNDEATEERKRRLKEVILEDDEDEE